MQKMMSTGRQVFIIEGHGRSIVVAGKLGSILSILNHSTNTRLHLSQVEASTLYLALH